MAVQVRNGLVFVGPPHRQLSIRHPHFHHQRPRRGEYVFVKPNGSSYTSVRGFRSACQRAGLSKVTPHTLRHTFASRLLASGVDPIMATKLGGWSSIKMLDRYAHADPSRMAEAVEKLVRNSSTGTSSLEKPRIVKTA